MSTQDLENRIVDSLATMMKGKLRANAYKACWRSATLSSLLNDLKGEIDELEKAIHEQKKPSSIRMECADAANMLAMIADIARADSPDDDTFSDDGAVPRPIVARRPAGLRLEPPQRLPQGALGALGFADPVRVGTVVKVTKGGVFFGHVGVAFSRCGMGFEVKFQNGGGGIFQASELEVVPLTIGARVRVISPLSPFFDRIGLVERRPALDLFMVCLGEESVPFKSAEIVPVSGEVDAPASVVG